MTYTTRPLSAAPYDLIRYRGAHARPEKLASFLGWRPTLAQLHDERTRRAEARR